MHVLYAQMHTCAYWAHLTCIIFWETSNFAYIGRLFWIWQLYGLPSVWMRLCCPPCHLSPSYTQLPVPPGGWRPVLRALPARILGLQPIRLQEWVWAISLHMAWFTAGAGSAHFRVCSIFQELQCKDFVVILKLYISGCFYTEFQTKQNNSKS